MRITTLTTGILAAALMGGCAGTDFDLMGGGDQAPSRSDIRLVAQGEYGGREASGHQIVPTAASLPTGHGDVAIETDEKLVILHAGTHADGRYSMQVSTGQSPGSVRLDCEVTTAEAEPGMAFTQAIVRPWRGYAVPTAAEVVVNDCGS